MTAPLLSGEALNAVTKLRLYKEIAVIAVDSPPVNALGALVRQGIHDALERAAVNPSVRAIVLICEGRTFFAGADIREIGKPMAEPTLRQLQIEIEQNEKPVIVAMHGSALGGGLELAMAAHFRVALTSAKLGLPEVQLGLLPGAGGTQRLPRLVGIEAALTLMTQGEPITAHKAAALGLIDRLLDGADLEAQAVAFAQSGLAEGMPPLRTRDRQVPVPEAAQGGDLKDFVASLRMKHRGFAAAENIIQSVLNTLDMPFDEGIAAEAELFEELKSSPQSAALRYAFFAERQAGKPPEPTAGEDARDIRRIRFLGKGARVGALANATRSSGLMVASSDPSEDEALFDALIMLDPALPDDDIAKVECLARQNAKAIVAVPPALLPALHVHGLTEGVAVDFGDSGCAPGLIEIISAGASPAVVTALLRLGRSLGLVATMSREAGYSVVSRLRAARDRQVAALHTEGVALARINAVLIGFGFPPLADDTRSEGRDQPRADISDKDILSRIILAIVNQAIQTVAAGAVVRPADVDVIAVAGLGWPRFEGGPLYWGDRRGLQVVLEELTAFQTRSGDAFRPADLLVTRAALGQSLISET
jgi:enoyl-CoA hydratase/carnithine racemase